MVKKVYKRKLELPGQIAQVRRQVNQSIVEIDINGRSDTVNVECLSPVEIEGDDGPSVKEEITETADPNDWRTRLRPRPTKSVDQV